VISVSTALSRVSEAKYVGRNKTSSADNLSSGYGGSQVRISEPPKYE
jgi:hypothetical protein